VTPQETCALIAEVRAHLTDARGFLSQSGADSVRQGLAALESAARKLQILVSACPHACLNSAEMDALAAQLRGLTLLAAHGASFWTRLAERSGISPPDSPQQSWAG
jgi:hypothetical protein